MSDDAPRPEPSRFPARLHALLARDAPVGVVIRRGPSRRVCALLWDRETDEFRVGQWFHGRIYERRSDLSPDGRHLIYFALNGKWEGEAGGSWTAISRAPYLKALTLLAKGDGWHGGGLFTGAGRYRLNDGAGHRLVRDSREIKREPGPGPFGEFGGECLGVYYPRLIRDGWSLLARSEKFGERRSRSIFRKAPRRRLDPPQDRPRGGRPSAGQGLLLGRTRTHRTGRDDPPAGLGVGRSGRPAGGLGRGRQAVRRPA